jgi:type II secretory pathway pseudopilin PulG
MEARSIPRAELVPWNRNESHTSRAGHPDWRRCRAPRSGACATHHDSGGLAHEHGASLLEVLIAIAIFASALVSLAQLFAFSTRTTMQARVSTFTTILAEQKMEQLRSLQFGYDALGLPVTDLHTNTAAASATPNCPAPSGGAATGLSPSPTGVLSTPTDGYVDYVDRNGCTLGGGARPPPGAVYVRRWSIERLPDDPDRALVLQVLVTRDVGARLQEPVQRAPGDAWLVSVKARTLP